MAIKKGADSLKVGNDNGNEIELLQIFKDLKGEIKKITDEKGKLSSSLDGVKNDLKGIQAKEMELRDMITEFANSESQLNDKRISLEKKLNDVTAKLDKLSKVQKELADVWA